MNNLEKELLSHARKWHNQKAQRTQLGEKFEKPRQVDHFLYFRKSENAEKAAAVLRGWGYEVSVSKIGMLKYGLQAVQETDLTEDSVVEFLGQMVVTAHENGGVYDGFGSPVVS